MSNEKLIKQLIKTFNVCSDCGEDILENDFKFITIDDKVLCKCCYDEYIYNMR